MLVRAFVNYHYMLMSCLSSVIIPTNDRSFVQMYLYTLDMQSLSPHSTLTKFCVLSLFTSDPTTCQIHPVRLVPKEAKCGCK